MSSHLNYLEDKILFSLRKNLESKRSSDEYQDSKE